MLADAPQEPFTLCGYSLGGRVAQLVALAAPARVSNLILVSTSAGIDDEAEGAVRRAADDALAAEITDLEPGAFADRWQAQPVFAGTAPAATAAWREDLLRNRPADLAVALSALSTGRMPSLWGHIAELAMPVTLVVGDRDAKFVPIAERYRRVLPDAELIVVPEAGHGLPREAPAALAAVIGA